MKILFFVATFPCISETFVLNQVAGLLDKGHDVRIFSWGKADSTSPHEDFVKYNLSDRVTYLKKIVPQNKFYRVCKIIPFVTKQIFSCKHKLRPLLSKRYGKQAKNLMLLYIADSLNVMKWSPEVIISHFGDNGLIMSAMREAKIVNKEITHYVFFHAHEMCGVNPQELSQIYKPLFLTDDFILPISNFWKSKLLSSGAKFDRVKVFHMGIDCSRFPFQIPCKIKDHINILSVGRLVGQKGFEYSIQAVVDFVASTHQKVIYTIIGGGMLENKLKKMVNKLGASEYIKFLGVQNQDAVSRYLGDADLFLLPSVTDSDGYMEGIPVALMEAMAMGKICVSTYHSGIPELIIDGENGFLCQEKNTEDIVKAIKHFQEMSIVDIEKMAKSARRSVLNNYNIHDQLNKLDDLLTTN